MPDLKTLRDLDVLMASPEIGSVTLSVAANGKVYATVHFRQPNMSYHPENQWGDSTEEALLAILNRPRSKPVAAQRRNTMEDLL